MSRMGYDGIAVCVPVTVPYSRYSLRSAHWFCGRALADLIAGAGVAKADVDGFCISSFTNAIISGFHFNEFSTKTFNLFFYNGSDIKCFNLCTKSFCCCNSL